MATTIDTLQLAKRFKDVQLSDAQAELFAEVFRETEQTNFTHLATKADLERVEATLRMTIETKIAEAKFDLLKWIIPILAAQLITLIGLFFK